jgi:hypothetical protein
MSACDGIVMNAPLRETIVGQTVIGHRREIRAQTGRNRREIRAILDQTRRALRYRLPLDLDGVSRVPSAA